MFCFGVQNLAEPANELQKSYDQFLHRTKLHEERKTEKLTQLEKKMVSGSRKLENGEASKVFYIPTFSSEDQSNTDTNLNDSRCNSKDIPATDDTIAVKRFVGKAITEKTEVEDALHHGLVDATINMKEVMNAISNMFKEPLDLETIARRKSRQTKPKENQKNSVINVYIDSPVPQMNQNEAMVEKPSLGAFKIWTDEDDNGDDTNHNAITEQAKDKNSDDTVIRNFMGSTDEDDIRVENACHNGLVDPTVNIKEAIDDINGMFGDPGNLMRTRRGKEQEGLPVKKKAENQGFCILADDDFDEELSGNASVLVVQEKHSAENVWKLPTGFIHKSEEIFAGAVREVKEETGTWIIGVIVGGILLLVLIGLSVWYLIRKREYRNRRLKRTKGTDTKSQSLGSISASTTLVKYSFEEIRAASKKFSRDNIIGKGGYGNMYKGKLRDGSKVALKRFKNCSAAGDESFAHEVEVIASVRHVNLVALRGYCTATTQMEGHQRIIVRDLMKNGSFDDHLFSSEGKKLSWPIRQRIAIGTARGLAYLLIQTSAEFSICFY